MSDRETVVSLMNTLLDEGDGLCDDTRGRVIALRDAFSAPPGAVGLDMAGEILMKVATVKDQFNEGDVRSGLWHFAELEKMLNALFGAPTPEVDRDEG